MSAERQCVGTTATHGSRGQLCEIRDYFDDKIVEVETCDDSITEAIFAAQLGWQTQTARCVFCGFEWQAVYSVDMEIGTCQCPKCRVETAAIAAGDDE